MVKVSMLVESAVISLWNDYCFSVLGHAVARILQLDTWVLLDFFSF